LTAPTHPLEPVLWLISHSRTLVWSQLPMFESSEPLQ